MNVIKLKEVARNAGKKIAAGTALAGAGIGSAMAVTSPGAAIAGELAGGKSEVMLVIAAAAVIIGLLLLWAYVKRAK